MFIEGGGGCSESLLLGEAAVEWLLYGFPVCGDAYSSKCACGRQASARRIIAALRPSMGLEVASGPAQGFGCRSCRTRLVINGHSRTFDQKSALLNMVRSGGSRSPRDMSVH